MAVCLSVYVCLCLSVTNRSSIETVEQIELGFGRGSFLPPILHCVNRKFGYLQKIMVLPSGETADTCQFQLEVLVARSRRQTFLGVLV